MSSGPRSLLGLPGGAIIAGAPADLVAWQPEADFTVDPKALAHRNPITPYAGRRLSGRVRDVWLRGTPIVSDGRLNGPPMGRLLLSES